MRWGVLLDDAFFHFFLCASCGQAACRKQKGERASRVAMLGGSGGRIAVEVVRFSEQGQSLSKGCLQK